MQKKILQQKEKVLRHMAHEVHIADIKTKKIKKVLKEMSEALKSQDDGVAIAAPQIGYSLRIFIVSGKIFSKDFLKERAERIEKKHGENVYIPDAPETEEKEFIKDIVFINPK